MHYDDPVRMFARALKRHVPGAEPPTEAELNALNLSRIEIGEICRSAELTRSTMGQVIAERVRKIVKKNVFRSRFQRRDRIDFKRLAANDRD